MLLYFFSASFWRYDALCGAIDIRPAMHGSCARILLFHILHDDDDSHYYFCLLQLAQYAMHSAR